MTDRNDLIQRIAQILREHQYLAYQKTGECGCGYECFRGEHWEHVAERIVKELGDD